MLKPWQNRCRGFTPLSELLGQVAVVTHDALLRAAAAPPWSAASGWSAHACKPGSRVDSGAAAKNGGSQSSGRGEDHNMSSWRAARQQPTDAGGEVHTQQGLGTPQHSSAAQAAALRALAAFLAAAPLHRLPPELLPRCIAVRLCWSACDVSSRHICQPSDGFLPQQGSGLGGSYSQTMPIGFQRQAVEFKASVTYQSCSTNT